MSEHEVVDTAGRTWKFERRTGRKTWVTDVGGVEVLLMSDANVSGWVLHRPWDADIPMGESQISSAVNKAQQYLGHPLLPPPGSTYIITTENVRDAFALTHSALGTAGFDDWLARHDEEIIASVTSAMEAVRSAP